MLDTAYPPPEESLALLRRSGSSVNGCGFTLASGAYVHQVDGRNGENRIRVEGDTAAEAWHRAVRAG